MVFPFPREQVLLLSWGKAIGLQLGSSLASLWARPWSFMLSGVLPMTRQGSHFLHPSQRNEKRFSSLFPRCLAPTTKHTNSPPTSTLCSGVCGPWAPARLGRPKIQPSRSPSGKCPRPARGSHLPADRCAPPGAGARPSGPACLGGLRAASSARLGSAGQLCRPRGPAPSVSPRAPPPIAEMLDSAPPWRRPPCPLAGQSGPASTAPPTVLEADGSQAKGLGVCRGPEPPRQ